MPTLDSPLRPVVGGRAATVLAKALDLVTVRDLLRHYPRRYDEQGELTDLAQLELGEDATVMAKVSKVNGRPLNARGRAPANYRQKHLLEVTVSDGKRSLRLTFFNQIWRQKELKVGVSGLFAGKVTEFNGQRQLNNPQYLLFDSNIDSGAEQIERFAGALFPIYPATAELTTWTIARCVRTVLDVLDPPPDPIPDELRAQHGLMDLDDALRHIHRPGSRAALAAAQTRLTWDEALTLQITLAQRRASTRDTPGVPRPPRSGGLATAFDAALPFSLTGGQRDIGAVIAADLAAAHPMNRLLQGEVGSGKTVVALRAMLQVIDAAGQAALLAPTEVLAAQHARSLRQLLGPLALAGELGAADPATRVVLLTGSQGAAGRREALGSAADGSAGIVVGTHALIQEGVSFADLGLVVVDEQHRFGVEQRDALRAKGHRPPHVLVMTATPIPRTVAMTVYGDLETSALRELPAGRSPISSSVIAVAERPQWLQRAWERIREEVALGRQAYIVCPRIGDEAPGRKASGGDGSEDLEDTEPSRRPPLAVIDVAAELAAGPLAGLAVEILHGRLPPETKEAVMARFTAGETDVLVATTVVEVGVDVANATVMVVMDAERFGLSQLHQLRGRIGRGDAPGVCLFVTEAPVGNPSRERLDAVAATTDGFAVARLDLETRREGDVLGAAQSGRRSQLRLLSLLKHEELIAEARAAAAALVAADPDLRQHPALAADVAMLAWDERAAFLEKA
ncbi:MAG: ATP-dependent DNA helicase RecG [Geodermatophilaceae bacterium]|nr:ATP-dependent DNA helicase RecG [Geodermatophilaceae bacterium]